MEQSKIIDWELIDSIGIITINNPPQNYLDEPDFVSLDRLKAWTSNKSLKGFIITGMGKHFSAGANKENINKFAAKTWNFQKKIKYGAKILNYIQNLPIPTIAAIKGACFGGGLEVALSCHIRVCSKNSLFSFPETDLELMPGLNGTIRLPRLIGMNKAIELILSGEIIDAEKAHKLNLVDHIVDSNEVFNYSLELIKKMTDNRHISVINSVVKALNNSNNLTLKKAIKQEMKMFCKLALEKALRNKTDEYMETMDKLEDQDL